MRGEGKYKADFTVEDVYSFFTKTRETDIDITTFRRVIKAFNKAVTESIVYNSDEFRLPFRLGYLRIRKHKTKIKIDPNGKLMVSHLKPDWAATKKLWQENEEAKENKKIVYHTNKHTSGYYYKWYWDKRTCNITNSSVYSIIMTRDNSRLIAKALKENENLDYYE